jgi:hypothetical protein
VLGCGRGSVGRGRAGELVGEGLGLAVVFEADEPGVFGAVFSGADGAGRLDVGLGRALTVSGNKSRGRRPTLPR